MEFNWILITVIVAIVILLVIDIFVYRETIRETFADVIYRECKIYNSFAQDFCHSKFANYGQIQILKAIEDSKDKAERDMLQTVYNMKKDKKMFDVPCVYTFDNLTEEEENVGLKFYKKMMDVEDRSSNYNHTMSWAHCFYDPNTIKGVPLPNNSYDNPVYINAKNNQLTFADLELDKIKTFACKNPKLFFKDRTICCHFLMIKCSVLNESPLDVVVDSLRIVEFKDNKFQEVTTGNMIKDFFTITYDDKKVVYTPMVQQRDFVSFDQDLCGNKIQRDTQSDNFHLDMCGLKNILLTDDINGLGIKNAPGIYPYESDKSMTISVRTQQLLEDLARIDKELVTDKKQEFSDCSVRYLQTMNYIQSLKMSNDMDETTASNFISDYTQKLKDIKTIIDSLNTYGMYYVDNTGCGNNVDNKAVLTLLKARYVDCEGIMKRLNLSTQPLDDFIKKADSIINDPNFNFTVPETLKQELVDLINKAKTPEIISNCKLNPSLDMQLVKIKIENARAYLQDQNLRDNILNNFDNLQLPLDKKLIQYMSFDNAIYIKID